MRLTIEFDDATGKVTRLEGVPLHEVLFRGVMAVATDRGVAKIREDEAKAVVVAALDDVPAENGHGLRRVQ